MNYTIANAKQASVSAASTISSESIGASFSSQSTFYNPLRRDTICGGRGEEVFSSQLDARPFKDSFAETTWKDTTSFASTSGTLSPASPLEEQDYPAWLESPESEATLAALQDVDPGDWVVVDEIDTIPVEPKAELSCHDCVKGFAGLAFFRTQAHCVLCGDAVHGFCPAYWASLPHIAPEMQRTCQSCYFRATGNQRWACPPSPPSDAPPPLLWLLTALRAWWPTAAGPVERPAA